MDVIVGIAVTLGVLIVWAILTFSPLKIPGWAARKDLTFMAKLMISFLVGFIFFILLTARVELLREKVAIVGASIFLIFAIFLRVKKE
jgi:hypothetical protein